MNVLTRFQQKSNLLRGNWHPFTEKQLFDDLNPLSVLFVDEWQRGIQSAMADLRQAVDDRDLELASAVVYMILMNDPYNQAANYFKEQAQDQYRPNIYIPPGEKMWHKHYPKYFQLLNHVRTSLEDPGVPESADNTYSCFIVLTTEARLKLRDVKIYGERTTFTEVDASAFGPGQKARFIRSFDGKNEHFIIERALKTLIVLNLIHQGIYPESVFN